MLDLDFPARSDLSNARKQVYVFSYLLEGISSILASLICIGFVIITTLFVFGNLVSDTLIEIPGIFNSIATTYYQLGNVDSFSLIFETLFIIQLAVIIGFILYCDCPFVVWLEIKLVLFFICTCHILVLLSSLSQFIMFEYIGILSFRLIGHYLTRYMAIRGSIMAITVNRLGDFIFLLWASRITGIVLRYLIMDNWWFDLILLSVSIKSILIWSYVWLPDAMEGPTPVSTLLHSATLILVGMIVLIRTVAISFSILITIMLLGQCVINISWSSDPDIKKILALSTCIMVSLFWMESSISNSTGWALSIVHARYKATLFITIGLWIVVNDTQDSRTMTTRCQDRSILSGHMTLYCTGSSASSYAASKIGVKSSLGYPTYITRTSSVVLSLILVIQLIVLWLALLIMPSQNDPTSELGINSDGLTSSWAILTLLSIMLDSRLYRTVYLKLDLGYIYTGITLNSGGFLIPSQTHNHIYTLVPPILWSSWFTAGNTLTSVVTLIQMSWITFRSCLRFSVLIPVF